MQNIITLSLSGIIAGLVLSLSSINKNLPMWNDTLEHKTISLIVWFLVFMILGYLVLRDYIHARYAFSKVSRLMHYTLVTISSLLVFIVLGIQILNINSIVSIPKDILFWANNWYALPVSLVIHYIVLWLIHKY